MDNFFRQLESCKEDGELSKRSFTDAISRFENKSQAEWGILNTMIMKNYEEYQMQESTRTQIIQFVKEMQHFLRKHIYGARLIIVGSVMNGLGTVDSDVNLCFQYESDTPPNGKEDKKATVYKIAAMLRSRGFECRVAYRVVDITSSNTLNRPIRIYYYGTSINDTCLIRKYCEWEPLRFQPLCLFVKKWVKICGIGDHTSRNGKPLTNYHWTIMLISYLQSCEPPVLPRIQEHFINSQHPLHFQELVVPNWSRNDKSVAELFVGFLDYLSAYDYRNYIFQIRQKGVFTKEERRWSSHQFCIEDPFRFNEQTVIYRSYPHYSEYVFSVASYSKGILMTSKIRENTELLSSCRLNFEVPTNIKCKKCRKKFECKKGCENEVARHFLYFTVLKDKWRKRQSNGEKWTTKGKRKQRKEEDEEQSETSDEQDFDEDEEEFTTRLESLEEFPLLS